MWEFAPNETHPVFPVFLLLDTSASMCGEPIQAINDALPGLRGAIAENATVGEIARIGVITFSDSARAVVPLSDLFYTDVPPMPCGGGTNFAEAFRVARREIEGGIRALGIGTPFHTPVAFFMSDGHHHTGEDWTGPLGQLRDKRWKFRPEIVTFGFGDASSDNLSRIASRYAFMGNGADMAGQAREIISTLIGSVRTMSGTSPSGHRGLLVEPDPTRFIPLPVLGI